MCRLEPNRTLATKRLSRKKLQKKRITIALTTNADGSTKLLPFVIHKYAHPRAFTRRNISNPNKSCVLTLQTYMEQRSNDTTKSASMLLEIEKHLKIVNASESVQRTIDSYFVS